MRIKDIIFGVVDIFIWYLFIYYWLYAIDFSVDPFFAAIFLLILLALGVFMCPFVYKSSYIKNIIKGKGELKVKDVLKSYENKGKEKK